MRKAQCALVALLALLVSCSGSEAATTTSTTLATTTAAPTTTSTSTTTTSTTTTVPPTTVPPPPVSSTEPVDPGAAEINERLDALWRDWKGCLAEPAACDIDAFADEYATPDSIAARVWRQKTANAVVDHTHTINLERAEPFVASVDVTDLDAVSEVCYRDAATAVAADGSIVDDSIVLYRFEWIWSKVHDKWMIVVGTHYLITEEGDSVCDAYFP